MIILLSRKTGGRLRDLLEQDTMKRLACTEYKSPLMCRDNPPMWCKSDSSRAVRTRHTVITDLSPTASNNVDKTWWNCKMGILMNSWAWNINLSHNVSWAQLLSTILDLRSYGSTIFFVFVLLVLPLENSGSAIAMTWQGGEAITLFTPISLLIYTVFPWSNVYWYRYIDRFIAIFIFRIWQNKWILFHF